MNSFKSPPRVSWLALLIGFFSLNFAAAQDIKLVPQPRSIAPSGGYIELSGSSRVVFDDASLSPLAKIVAKYDCRDGADRIHFWLNPAMDAEPANADAETLSIQEDLGQGNRFGINVQGHGSGEYVFDEIRIGINWGEVSGQ